MLGGLLRKPNFRTENDNFETSNKGKGKRDTLGFFNNQFDTFENFRKSRTVPEKIERGCRTKIEIHCLEAAPPCKKIAHTHRFKLEASGLKNKNLTTRP